MSKVCPQIERLEARLAPAVVIVNAHVARYLDVDGDLVTIVVSQGRLTAADFTSVPAGVGDQLQLIDFSGQAAMFDGASISVTATPSELGGNGEADIGKLDAAGVGLHSIRIDGDLGDLQVGRNVATAPKLELLELGSLGAAGLGTQALGGDLASQVRSRQIGEVIIHGDVMGRFEHNANEFYSRTRRFHIEGALLSGTPEQDANVYLQKVGLFRVEGSIVGDQVGRGVVTLNGFHSNASVGGSIIGGTLNGQLMDRVYVKGSLVGVPGFEGGYINDNAPEGSAGRIFVGGSLIGGPNGGGFVVAQGIQSITVAGDLDASAGSGAYISGADGIGRAAIGGSIIGGGAFSGFINGSRLGEVHVNGDVRGGAGPGSGTIASYYGTNSVTVGGSVVGGSGEALLPQNEGEALAQASGAIYSHGTIRHVTIGNDLRGGEGDYSGSITVSAIEERARIRILFLEIGGSVIGGDGEASGYIYQGLTNYRNGSELGVRHATIGGSIVGGEGDRSGRMEALRLGEIRIGGDLRGGGGDGSAVVGGEIRFLDLGGSVLGGDGFGSGGLFGVVRGTVHGDIEGGSAQFSGQAYVYFGGRLRVEGSILGGTGESSGYLNIDGSERVYVQGSVRGGLIDFRGSFGDGRAPFLRIDGDVVGNGDLFRSNQVAAVVGDRLGTLQIGGSVFGSTIRVGLAQMVSVGGDFTGFGGAEATLEASITTTRLAALENVVIGGSMDHAVIRSGTSVPNNAGLPGRIGRIVVEGNFSASSISAGIHPGLDGQYGTADDFSTHPAPDQSGRPTSRIGTVVIGGRAIGTSAVPGDHFGIVAEQIGRVIVDGRELPLQPGPHNDTLDIARTGDVSVTEVRVP